jgi:hypothetical protein
MNAAHRRRSFERDAKYRISDLEDLVRRAYAAASELSICAYRVTQAKAPSAWANKLSRMSDQAATIAAAAHAAVELERPATYCKCGFPSPHPDEAEWFHDLDCPRRLHVLEGNG